MTPEDFLKKYPRPWSFERTDRSGDGLILDATGRPLVILAVDLDWDEHNEGIEEPIFCNMESERGLADIEGEEREERDTLVELLCGWVK